MYQADVKSVYAFQGHPQGRHRIVGVKNRTDAPADNLLAVGIKYKRQVNKVIVALVVHYYDICNAAHPQLVCRRRNEILDKVRVYLFTEFLDFVAFSKHLTDVLRI